MPLDPADAIRRFEPILYFHRDEEFFPSDAKRYLEHAALWDVKGVPRDSKARWGGTSPRTLPHFPRIPRGKVVVVEGEAPRIPQSADGVAGTFIGEPGLSTLHLTDSDSEERFLDLSGWVGGDAVDQASANRYSDLAEIAARYNGGEPALTKSRFWYHAEVFTAPRLRGLVGGRPSIYRDRFAALKNPALVCYYLFFPGHREGLEGCETDHGKNQWASCAGEWACVSVLLAGDDTLTTYTPVMIGLTSRNVGVIDFLGQERRVGMRVVDWNLATTVVRDRGPGLAQGEHPRIFVARGTHGLYLERISVPVAPYSPADASGSSCGQYELPAAQAAAAAATAADRAEDETLMLTKLIAASAVGALHGLPMAGFIGGAIGGALVAVNAILLEMGGMAKVAGLEPPDDLPDAQVDHPPAAAETGFVVHPAGLDPPEAPSGRLREWPRFDPANELKLDTSIDGRAYSLWVATPAAPDSRPIWLPSETPTQVSFRGRWGNRVVDDPFTRRAGMKFPEFWAMFFDGLGKS
ncbi:MAG: hypothetical protein ACFCVH_08800 [Alphaproteobacteria bacterium]